MKRVFDGVLHTHNIHRLQDLSTAQINKYLHIAVGELCDLECHMGEQA